MLWVKVRTVGKQICLAFISIKFNIIFTEFFKTVFVVSAHLIGHVLVTINPTDKSLTHGSGDYWCKTPNCLTDLNEICPKELQLKSPNTSEVIGCFNYPRTFKEACPTAYSYAYDDHTSTFFCKNTDYEIIVC